MTYNVFGGTLNHTLLLLRLYVFHFVRARDHADNQRSCYMFIHKN